MSREVAVRLENLSVEIESSSVEIDHDVTLDIFKGEVLGLVGESASGKTTVATSLLAFQRRGARIAGGRILLEGRDVLAMSPAELRAARGKLVAYVPQDPSMSLNPALRIHTQLAEILKEHGYGESSEDRDQRLAQMMDEVLLPGDEHFLKRYPHQLSGGQQQRVVLAMAFACQPSIIVLDEPTTGLDVTTQAHVLKTIRGLAQAHEVAALYVTHDLAVINELADRVAVMYAGRIVEVGSKSSIFARPRHPYTHRLLSAVPDLDATRMPEGIPGVAPRPGHRPEGCAFAPRCSWAIDKCRSDVPALEPLAGGEVACWRADEAAGNRTGHRQTDPCRYLRPAPQGETLLVVGDVSAWHGKRKSLHGIDISVGSGWCLALVGESGSGKTTLARCVSGLHTGHIDGDIAFKGQPLKRRARSRSRGTRQAIQYIFQSPYSSLNPRKTVAQHLQRPLRAFFSLDQRGTERAMIEALEHVALDASVLNRYPDQLSGGERQRVAIARALAAKPDLLICDEVTSSLDVSVQATIVELLSHLIDETGIGMVFVTHHLALVRAIAQEVAVMSEGRIVETGTTSEVLDHPKDDYTRALLADTPRLQVEELV
jgi:peptide/nickel transport system ATP-binding protein